jgi:restriction endonuclease S subunit
MKSQVIQSTEVLKSARLDSWYFLSPGKAALNNIEKGKKLGFDTSVLGGPEGIGKVWTPNRIKQALAGIEEHSTPYLRPYDVFNYYPEPSAFISVSRTENFDSYKLKEGMILQTCSGRNLGPLIVADKHLSNFVLSNDMIRIEIEDKQLRYYCLAFLNSQTGRNLLRRDKTGSVVDHISTNQVKNQEVLLFEESIIRKVSSIIEKSIKFREYGRLLFKNALNQYENMLPTLEREKKPCLGWNVVSRSIEGRLDAAFYDPLVKRVRKALLENDGFPLVDVADVMKPGDRYKPRYVNRENGLPILSGRQLLQTVPINLRYISPSSFKNVNDYSLHKDWIAYPADGRVEGELGNPVIITADREGWLASGHVGRIIPKDKDDLGFLYLALKSQHSQIQIKSRASGSVVDSTFEDDMERTILPGSMDIDGTKIIEAWENLCEAQMLENQGISMINDAFQLIN